jgi:hypothetical protein
MMFMHLVKAFVEMHITCFFPTHVPEFQNWHTLKMQNNRKPKGSGLHGTVRRLRERKRCLCKGTVRLGGIA